jgi:hypothetical protein
MEFPQSLLNDPNVVAMSRSKGQTPHEYLSLILNNNPTALAPTTPTALATPVQDNQGTYPTFGNDNRIPSGDMNAFVAGTTNLVEAGNARSQEVLNGPADRAMAATAATEDGRPIGQGGVLQNNQRVGTVGFQDPTQSPALSAGGQGATSGSLTNGGVAAPRPNAGPTSGARQTPTNNTGNSRQSGMPDMRIGRMAQIGRMGTAMLGSAGDGLLASMSAGGEAMYAVNDENRQAELAEYADSERIRLEKAKAAAAARSGSGGAGGAGGASPYGSVGAQAAQFNEIIAALRSDGNMTGPVAGRAGSFLDRSGYGDTDRANMRLQMEGIALNEQLLYTAQTKGAITDREMAMFRRPIPKITDDEGVWIAWLEPRAAVLNQLANNGISDAAAASSGGGQTTAPAFNASDYTVVEITE